MTFNFFPSRFRTWPFKSVLCKSELECSKALFNVCVISTALLSMRMGCGDWDSRARAYRGSRRVSEMSDML